MADDQTELFSRAVSTAGALFFDEQDRVLLLEPTYKDYEFADLEAATARLIPRLGRRVAAAVRARNAGRTVYLEHGVERGAGKTTRPVGDGRSGVVNG